MHGICIRARIMLALCTDCCMDCVWILYRFDEDLTWVWLDGNIFDINYCRVFIIPIHYCFSGCAIMQLPEFILYTYNWLKSKLDVLHLGSGMGESLSQRNVGSGNAIGIREHIIVRKKKDDNQEKVDLRIWKNEIDISDIRHAIDSISNHLSQRIAKMENRPT